VTWRTTFLVIFSTSVVVLLLNLFAGPLLAWPFMLVLFLVVGVYFWWFHRELGLASFLPAAFYLIVLWINFSAKVILPHIASLDYSILNITDPGEEVARAWLALRLLPLIPLVGFVYLSRSGLPALVGDAAGGFLDNIKQSLPFTSSKTKAPDTVPVDKNREKSLKSIGIKPPSDDLTICYSETGRPVKMSDKDRYLHMLVVGPTGAGKTSRILKPMVEQEIKSIRSSLLRGIPRGLTVIEPKGDFASDVYEMARHYNVPVIYIDPLREDSNRFNPLEGDPTLVAEATRTVLQATFGRQEAFYQKVQEVAARNTVLLLKYSRRDDVTMFHMSQLLRDHTKLREEVNKLSDLISRIDGKIARAEADGNRRDLEWLKYLKQNRERIEELLKYFEIEILSEKIGEKIHQFALGLRLQVDDLAGNEYLGRVIGGRSDVNLDAHLNRGGVLVVNTAMGHLGKLGDTFGQFLVMHFQNAVFRRKGNEWTRPRHMLIMDEAHRYINPDFERLLAMGRGFRCECVLALQNTAQLAIDEKRSFRDSVFNLCRNKIVFGGMDNQEARFFATEFGEIQTKKMQRNYAGTLLYKQPWKDLKYREIEQYEKRFDYTFLIELPAYHVVHRIVKDGKAMPPEVGITQLSDWDRKFKYMKPEPVAGLQVSNQDVQVVSGTVSGDPTEIRM